MLQLTFLFPCVILSNTVEGLVKVRKIGVYMKKLMIVMGIFFLSMSLSACGKNKKETMSSSTNEMMLEEKEEDEETLQEEEDTDEVVLDKAQIIGMADEIKRNMTLEEKIGQLFLVNFEQLDTRKGESYNFQKVTATMREAIKKYKVGGVIFFSGNIDTPKQTKEFIRKLQKFSSVPMFISVDEEGGEVARIANNEAMGTTKFPTMEEVGKMQDEDYAYTMGRTIGSEIKELGFNVNFAPVADVRTDEKNTEIGTRSFGSDSKVVANLVSQVVTGLQEEQVVATLKHFPGQGSNDGNSHEGSVDIISDINELRKTAFVPFKAGIKADVDMIMVSHASISSVTGSTKPSSMTELVMKDILRTELSFDGIIITDAMNMKAVTNYYTSGEASVNALKAGADVVLMPEDFKAAYRAVLNAVEEGEIEEKSIDEKVQRILELKIERGIVSVDTKLLTQE